MCSSDLSARRRALEQVVSRAEEALGGWDGPAGRSVLVAARSLLLRPARLVLAAMPPIHVDPLPDDLPTVCASAVGFDLNATAMAVTCAGLETVQPFQLSPAGRSHVETTSAFTSLDVAMHVNASFRGPIGLHVATPLVLRCKLSEVSIVLTWRAKLKRSVASQLGSDVPMASHQALDVKLESVRVTVDGPLTVRVDRPGETGSGGVSASAWRVLSKLFEGVLRETVERELSAAILDALHAAQLARSAEWLANHDNTTTPEV